MLSLTSSSDANGTAIVGMTLAAGESIAEAVTVSLNGTPLNITGYAFKMTIAFASPLLLSTANGGITLTDPTNGVLQINISDATSTLFSAGSYAYDLWMVNGSTAIRLFIGTFNVLGSITAIP